MVDGFLALWKIEVQRAQAGKRQKTEASMSAGDRLWLGVAELFADMDAAAEAHGWHRLPGEASAWVDPRGGRVVQWVANATAARNLGLSLSMNGPISRHASRWPGHKVDRAAGIAGAVFLVPPRDRPRGGLNDEINGERLRELLAWLAGEGIAIERLATEQWQWRSD